MLKRSNVDDVRTSSLGELRGVRQVTFRDVCIYTWRSHALSFQLLDKQDNFTVGLVVACEGKIQLRFQKRSHAAEEPRKRSSRKKMLLYAVHSQIIPNNSCLHGYYK